MDKELTGFEFTKTTVSYRMTRFALVKAIFPAIFENLLHENCEENKMANEAWESASGCVERILKKEYEEGHLFDT